MTDERVRPFPGGVTLHHGDCLEVLRTLPEASVDSIVTDPPYGLEFMGKEWDKFGKPSDVSRSLRGATSGLPIGPGSGRGSSPTAGRPGFDLSVEAKVGFQQWCEQWAQECLRVLKPGGHLLAFGGTRTWHRLTVAVEDAGFEVRDSIAWLYGSGFPKSLDVSKAVDKIGGVDVMDWFPEWLEKYRLRAGLTRDDVAKHFTSKSGGVTGCVWNWEHGIRTPTAKQFNDLCVLLGIPAEPIEVVERRVISERTGVTKTFNVGATDAVGSRLPVTTPATTAAVQWEGWGTALKPAFEPIVVARKPLIGTVATNVLAHGTGALNIDGCRVGMTPEDRAVVDARSGAGYGTGDTVGANQGRDAGEMFTAAPAGRWPANVILSHVDGCEVECVEGCPVAELDRQSGNTTAGAAGKRGSSGFVTGYDGDYDVPYGDTGGASRFFATFATEPPFLYQAKANKKERPVVGGVAHPTVKPLALMRWLVRLVTPPGGTVLDPFAGSGTTGQAAVAEGFGCILIEREADYLPLIHARLTQRETAAPEPEPEPGVAPVKVDLLAEWR